MNTAFFQGSKRDMTGWPHKHFVSCVHLYFTYRLRFLSPFWLLFPFNTGNGSILGDFGNFSAPLQPSSSVPPASTPSQGAFADFSSFQSTTALPSQSLLQPTQVCMHLWHLVLAVHSFPAVLVMHELAKEGMLGFRKCWWKVTLVQEVSGIFELICFFLIPSVIQHECQKVFFYMKRKKFGKVYVWKDGHAHTQSVGILGEERLQVHALAMCKIASINVTCLVRLSTKSNFNPVF